MNDQPTTAELILQPRVAYRGQEVAAPRLRSFLALLAGDLRTGCSTARLVEGLWPDQQPENPTKALQVLVSRARAQLGSDVIDSSPTGYRLSLAEDQVDSSAVLRSASASAQRSRAGDHAGALVHAEAGLALWEGAAGGDTVLDDPLSALRAERASTYRSLVRARALALSRLGRRAEAVEPLTELVGERPRDEELLLELLRCEAATVGPAAALARYDTYRRSLRDELGTDPGTALQAVYQQLLQGEAPVVRHGVPHEPNLLLGRDDDIAAVANLLRTSRVTSIVGAGGLGKTRLAYVVSRLAEQRVVHLVGLAGLTTDDDVVSEVASVLGVGESRPTSVSHLAIPRDVLAGIVNALRLGPVLLVLDNCENVVRGAAELVRALVSMTQNVRVLTTSRAPLGLSSESVYLLPELSLPTSVELFNQRASAARADVDLPVDVVEELCSHLDGLPLAVELAAARVRVMSVAEIASRLDDRFTLLRGDARDAPQRHRTLQAVIAWSWNLLEPAGQAALRALSVFPGGFTEDAARHLLGDGDTLRVLEHLVDQSLLKVADTGSGTRLRMLETVREFSTAHREAAGETDRVIECFLAWARDFAVTHHEGPFGADPAATVERIRAEQDNLVYALRHGLAHADGATVAAMSAVLGSLWLIKSDYARGVALTQDTSWVLSHFRPEPDLVGVTRTALTLCTMITFLIEGPRAVRSLVALRRLPAAPPSTLIRAVAIVLGAAPEVLGSDRSALQALCDSDEPLLAGAANAVAGYLAENEGDVDGALKAAGRMLEAFENRDSPWMRILAHSRIGELCVQLDRGVEAVRHLRAALLVEEELGSQSGEIGIRWGLVLANLQIGAIDEAEHWSELATLNQADEDLSTRTFGLGARAEISLARGEVEAGLRRWRRAVDQLSTFEDANMPIDPGRDPWALEIRAVAVVAHAQHGRLDLVEEAHRQVEPAPHAAGVRGGRRLRRLDQIELFEELGGSAAAFTLAQVVQVGHQDQVLFTGQVVVHRRELAGDADRAANRVGVPGQIVARDPYLATIGGDERGQDLNRGGLAGAVGAEQREDRAFRNVQIDAVEHNLVAVRLAQPGCGNRRLGWVRSHVPSFRRCGTGGHDLAEHARRGIHRGFSAASGTFRWPPAGRRRWCPARCQTLASGWSRVRCARAVRAGNQGVVLRRWSCELVQKKATMVRRLPCLWARLA